MSKEKVSVCVIAKNEEANLVRCLGSVKWADELVVVTEDNNTDRTVEVAKELGANVVIAPDWPGWAKQKNRSIDAASNDWILSLDADEWLEDGAESIVRAAIENPPIDAYTLARKTFFLGKWIAHQGWYPDRQVRLFRRSATRFSEVPVHEKVDPTANTADLELDILHESYLDLDQYFEKNNKYSTAQAKQQINHRLPLLKLFIKPPARFGQTYILQAGFLDGWRGLQLSALRAWYEFTVQKKILALRRTKPQ